jgi:DNA-directed RNA polymerase beta subunit
MDYDELKPIMMSAPQKRTEIRNKVIEGLNESFPVTSRNKQLVVKDVTFDEKDYTPTEQKRAILEGRSLYERVRGTVELKDKDGKTVDKVKDFTLARVPWFTPRHTVILDGNEYAVANQLRPKPGVYARKRSNGILEAAFNTQGGKNFNISMDPEKGQPYLEYKSTKIPLYPILRAAGIPHSEIAREWGANLANENEKVLTGKESRNVDKLYEKVIPEYHRVAGATTEQKVKQIFEKYQRSRLDPEVTSKTLGTPLDYVNEKGLLKASSKILKIYKDAAETDDRDHLDFKTIHSVEDFFKEVVMLNSRDIGRKAAIKIEANPDLRKALPPGPFTKGIRNFITSSQLASVPTQTNPVELIDSSMRVTSLGEGGIGTERAIPMEARNVHATQLSSLDPFRTPETFRAGVDVRAAMLTHKDKDKNIYVPLYDVKKKENVWVRPNVFSEKVVAFPNQKLTGKIEVMDRGQVCVAPAKKADYQVVHPYTMFGPTTNLVPLVETLQGNRTVMGSKMQVQALSLVDREEPFVQVEGPTGDSVERLTAQLLNPYSPVDGMVTKVDKDYVYIRPDRKKEGARGAGGKDADLVKVPYETYFPFAAKTHLTHEIHVKPGDKVTTDQQLADSNFTRNGVLALGKNMSVAYMPYKGFNSNDAVVVSESAAKKLTSERMYKVVVQRDPDLVFDRQKHQTYFGHSYTQAQYANVDDNGVIKEGTNVLPGDPVIFVLRKSQLSADDILLGRLNKSLVKPYRDGSEKWDHDHTGTVVDVVKTPQRITLTIKTQEPSTIGDKLAGRYGNKGVISKIVPDDRMVKDEQGRPIDILLTSAGVVSRTNPGQIVETALGKVVEKTGQPYKIKQFSGLNYVDFAKKELKKHGLKDKETVFDPETGKKTPGVFVGRQYMFKLMKSTDTNFGARGVANYDANEQPSKSGTESAKSLGRMEVDALIAHNARNVLQEASTLRSQRNDETWKAIQLGLPLPAPKESFAYRKFEAMLTGAGARVERKGSKIALAPLTDKDVMEMSAGEVKEPLLVRSKDLQPERGGLFDPVTTGGLKGQNWSHISLAEPVVNPLFRDPVRRLLRMTNSQLDKVVEEKGADYIRKELKKVDIDALEKELMEELNKKKGKGMDEAVKTVKYLRGLKSQNLRPEDAYILSKVPVTPPVTRPVIPARGGQELLYGDINPLYRDLLYTNNTMKEIKKKPLLPGEENKLRRTLHDAVGAVIGTNDPVTDTSKARNHKGFLTYIAGSTSPKFGYFNSKLMKKTMDISGRGTAVPDLSLDIDEIGVPEEMLWTMYSKFIVKKLVQNGYTALNAEKMVKDKDPRAREMLVQEAKERPVFMNRAPTLHRYNVLAAYPKLVPGKTIRVNPFMEKAQNLDYDGDCISGDVLFYTDNRLQERHISETPRREETCRKKGNKELYAVPEGLKVFGFSASEKRVKLCNVTEFSVHHDLNMVDVVTKYGKKVTVSDDHSLFGMNPETGCLERFRAIDGIKWPVVRPRTLENREPKTSIVVTTEETGEVTVALDEHFGWFLGTWAGDGWVAKDERRVGLANTDPAVRGCYLAYAQKWEPDISHKTYDNPHEMHGYSCFSQAFHLNSTKFARFFEVLVSGCRGAENKKLPSYFPEGPREFHLGILAGLIDTDGCISLVYAKGKKPQWLVNMTTTSPALADHASLVALLLGVKTGIYYGVKTQSDGTLCDYAIVTFSTPDMAKIAGELPVVHLEKKELFKQLSQETFDDHDRGVARYDTIPVPPRIIEKIQKLHREHPQKRETEKDKKALVTRQAQLTQSKKKNYMSRVLFKDLCQMLGEDNVKACGYGDWFELVINDSILWDYVDTITPLEGKHTAWDLTVDDGCTFMTSSQVVVYDTIQIHAPILPNAVEEAKGLTMRSILYSDKHRDDLLVFPQHEAIMGVDFAAAQDDKGKPVTFRTRVDAMKAYNEGKITLGTRVIIKEKN